MEWIVQSLQNYGRYLENKARLSAVKEAIPEGKYALREAEVAAAAARWEWNKLEKGSLFQRLLGNWEEKKEQAYRKYREAAIQEEKAKQDLQERKQTLEAVERELEVLSGSWEDYLARRQAYLRAGGDLQALQEAEAPVLAAILTARTRSCQTALEEARVWMRADVLRKGVSRENRKMEFLAVAREEAAVIVRLLELLPAGQGEIPSYLRNPDGYILGVTMEYKQLDRVNLAIEQLCSLRKRVAA